MAEAPVEIPASWWERVRADRRKLAATLGAGVLALALLGVAVAGVLGRGDSGDGPHVADLDLPPVDGISGEATAPAGVTGTTGSRPTDGSTGDDQESDDASRDPVSPPAFEVWRAPYIAYRLGDGIVVSRDDGTRPREVVTSPLGVFELSPDGSLLALVEEGELSVVSVADGARTNLGPADPLGLAWQPDSRAVYLVRMSGPGGSSEVWRAPVADGAPSKVVSGGPACVASDGTVAAPPVQGERGDPGSGSLWVVQNGAGIREITVPGQAIECTAEGGVIAYAVHGDVSTGDVPDEAGSKPEIRLIRFDGSGDRRLVGPPARQRPFGYGSLEFSPDGSHLLYAEVGDDGHSRAFVVPTETGGSPVSLTVRRDTYPFGWSADGSRVLFVEGNAFQGEPTALLGARPDGTGRAVLVEGAGL